MTHGIAKFIHHRPKLTVLLLVSMLGMGHAVWDRYYAPDQGKSYWRRTWDRVMDQKEFVDAAGLFAKGVRKVHVR
jgi:hypothetical protein